MKRLFHRPLDAIRRFFNWENVNEVLSEPDVPICTLYEAENEGHARLLWAIGDGSTTYLRLTIRNLRDYPIAIVIEPGTLFAPCNTSFQEMAVLRPTIVHLDAFETRSVWLNTACLQADRQAPENHRAQVMTYLRQQGLEASEIENIVEEAGDELRMHLDDLERVAEALSYTPARIQEIRDELENMPTNEQITVHMGYALAPISPERASWLRCITRAIEQMDTDIVRVSHLAERPIASLIEKYGRKNIILALGERGNTLKRFKEYQYFTHLDSGLANNIFQESGHQFQTGEAFQLVEFDKHNDPEWRSDPRLRSLVAQYAIWALTDGYGLDECCQRIKLDQENTKLVVGAGVRSLLCQAARIAPENGVEARDLESRVPLFSESEMERFMLKQALDAFYLRLIH